MKNSNNDVLKMKSTVYKKLIDGYFIIGAYVSKKNLIQISLKEANHEGEDIKSPEEEKTRLVFFAPDLIKGNDGFTYFELKNVGEPNALLNPIDVRSIILTDIFSVSEKGGPFEDVSKPRSEWDDYTRRGNHLRMIGERAYAVGSLRKLFRRDGVGKWTDLTDPKQHPNLFKRLKFLKERDGGYSNSYAGFRDVDGFNENDIYAGGRHDLWRYDGERWHEIELPKYPSISSVVCAKDGYVYVVGRNGPLLRGREDDWEVIDIPALDYNEMTWFDGKLWLASDYELGVYENGEYNRYEFPAGGPAQYSFNGVHSCDDVLLSYGLEQVMLFDGTHWVEFIGPQVH